VDRLLEILDGDTIDERLDLGVPGLERVDRQMMIFRALGQRVVHRGLRRVRELRSQPRHREPRSRVAQVIFLDRPAQRVDEVVPVIARQHLIEHLAERQSREIADRIRRLRIAELRCEPLRTIERRDRSRGHGGETGDMDRPVEPDDRAVVALDLPQERRTTCRRLRQLAMRRARTTRRQRQDQHP